MKRALLAVLAAIASAQAANVQTVYILPMAGHLDLYVAEWLARGKAVRVTADPKKADAILTDHLGEDFERRMDEITPHQSSPDAKKAASDSSPAHYSAARNRGTVFLVDAKTREVLWSDYEKPRPGASMTRLNREGEKIAKKLEADLAK